ncbi:MAG: transposase [Hyphomicrobiaceae bacterium]|nr:transposase [Hyphomicrobiaceae bacterium]
MAFAIVNQYGLNSVSKSAVKFDFDALAAALGVDRSTLPSAEVGKAIAQPRAAGPLVIFSPLSDADWAVLSTLLPKLPVAKPDVDYRDRDFIDSVLWWIAAREKGLGWGKLPMRYCPASSREHRFRRWSLLGYFQDLYRAIEHRDDLSPTLRHAFKRIARDADIRRERAVASRERLTGAR